MLLHHLKVGMLCLTNPEAVSNLLRLLFGQSITAGYSWARLKGGHQWMNEYHKRQEAANFIRETQHLRSD